MSDKQYAEYSRLAGEVSRHALTNSDLIKLDADNPTLGATTWINEVCTKSRSAVKDRLIKKWSGEDVTVDPAELGGEVREKALGSIAYSIARGEDETETTKAKARMIKELGVDKVKLSNILRQKLIKSSWDQGHKAKSATLRDWQRRLAFRLAQADKN